MPSKKYYERYKGRYKEKDAEWVKNNPDKMKAKAKRWYDKNRNEILEQKVQLYHSNLKVSRASARKHYCNSLNNPSYHLFKRTKYRAKELGIIFSLDPDDILIPEFCPILGIPLFRNIGGKGACDNSPTVDRLDGKLGYIKGNVAIISYRANRIKNDGSLEELEAIVNWIRQRKLLQSPAKDLDNDRQR